MGNGVDQGRRVMVMAGGTGGHVFPALAVADKLRALNIEISWLGTQRGIESELVPAGGFELHCLDIEGIRGRGIKALLKAPLLLWRSISQASKLLAEFKPAVVLGMGGFASGPGAVAARLKGIPVVIHEQNSVAGTTNKLSAKIAKRVMLGFPDALKNGEWCGNPVRPTIAAMPDPKERFTGREGKARILVLGGIPPNTKIRALPSRPVKRSFGSGIAAIVGRTGLPHHSPFLSASGKPNITRLAIFADSLLVVPATEFCSWITTGMPFSRAATAPGPEANPPIPSTTAGLNSASNFEA